MWDRDAQTDYDHVELERVMQISLTNNMRSWLERIMNFHLWGSLNFETFCEGEE